MRPASAWAWAGSSIRLSLRDILLSDFCSELVSVVLLTTDNGGGPWYSNTPLRGTKETLFEGGIRAASFLLSPLLQVRSSH